MDTNGGGWTRMDVNGCEWTRMGRGWPWMKRMGVDGRGWTRMVVLVIIKSSVRKKKYLLDVWGATSMWLSDDTRGGGDGHCRRAMVATVDCGCVNGRVACGCIECDADG